MDTARTKLVAAAKDAGIDLKQTFAKEGLNLSRKAEHYAHARQFNACSALPAALRSTASDVLGNAFSFGWASGAVGKIERSQPLLIF